MKTKQTAYKSTDEYIAGFPKEVQAILQKVRQTIKKAAPGAQEKISYNIPTFTLDGAYLIYFAGYKKHIGIYPVPVGTADFNKQIAGYVTGRGTVQFPLDRPIPHGLITKMVKFRIKDTRAKLAAKAKKKKQ